MKKIFKGKIKLLIGLTFLALFIFNTIAYSGLATKLAITSEAMFRPNVDIRITNIKLHSAENGAVESYSPKYNVDSTTTGFVLPNTSSKITYEVTVTNYGNVRQTIYKFIKNSISTDGVNIEISNFKPVYSDTSSDYNCTTDGTTANKNCTYKNSDFTIVSNKNYDDDKENEKVFYITFSTTNPSSTAKNVIENYKYRPVYKIDFNANGGQNAPSSIYKVFGESTSLPKETPTRSLYNFTGWSKSSTSTSAEYSAGGLYDLSEDESNIKNIKDITLYAVWQKKQATIDLNYNIDGTWYYAGYNNKIQTGIKVNGEDKGYLNDFSGTYDYGTNYEIYGFKIDGVTIPYSKKYTVDGTNHLGISFNTINFKVNDANLGSVTPIQLIVIPGTTYKVSNNVITLSDGRIATASPKTITGYTSKFSSYTITPNSTTINTKITATANFTKETNTYTITLDNKSATTAGTTAIYGKYGAGIYLDSALKNVMTTTTNKITVPAKTGYTFKGYYTKENGQGDQIINENGYITDKITNTTYTTNATLYAYYTATTYTVIYNSNGGTGTMANDTATYDSNFITTKNTFAKTGYTFNGWNEKTDGTGTVWGLTTSGVYESGKSWKWTYTKNITLYAQWKVNSYTLTVNPNGGTWNNSTSASTITQNYGTTYTLANPTKPGYTFTGWTLSGKGSLSGSTYTFADGAGTLTANYTESNYIVTYDATTNGGSTAKQTASTKYKSSVDLTKKAEKSGYEFVGWNTNKDSTSVLSSYEMPANDVTLYAIYKKELSATFNYYNSKSETKSVTIYNKATSGSITSPAALGTPNGYTFRHYSTSNAANAAKTIDANSAVILTSNQTYYASYQKNVTAKIYYSTLTSTDYVYSGASQTSVDVTAVKYLGYTGVEVDSIYTVPTAVKSSTGGASAEKYLGVSNKASDATVITPTTANTSYYAVYTESITFHYYNGTAHTKTILTRRMLSNGSSYSNSLSDSEPVVSNYDGASKTAWSYDPNHYESSYIITSLATGTNNLYAIYTKHVTATFNYYNGSKAATTTASSNKYYVSKDSGINTFNTNITIPDAAKASRGSYTYRGISTSNAANASVVTPTTANTTYYSSYTYAITANFTANGGTGTAPSSAAGTGYMNYSGSKIGISVTMPSNTFTRNGYTFGGWYDSLVNKTYTAGTSVTVDSSRNFNAIWNVVTYTIKYNLNGGTVSATNSTSYKVTDADITLNNPTKQGYTFTGWTGTGLSEASKAVTIKSGSYGNREYTANYSINQYYYDVNPDSGIKSFDITIDGKTSTGLTDYNQKHNYGTEATITNVVAKPGYTYTGYKVTGSMTTLTGSTNSNIKTKLGTGNGYIALTSTAKTLKFDAQTLASIKYSTTPQALVFIGADNGTGSYKYEITAGNTNGYFNINGTTITTSDTVVPPAGTYKLTVKATDDTSKVTATADITIVIEKVSSTNPTLTAYSGTYDGQQHTIGVTGGSGGTIQYSTDNKTWSTIKPTRTAQGTTTVYVKVVGDSNHTDTNPISSTITIKPATITYTANSFDDFYDGNAHSIMVNVTKPTSGATITYSLTENGTYSTTKPTVTNATTTPVTVYFKISASNYNSVSSKATITINKTNSVSPTLTAYSGTYDGKPHTIGVTGGSGGTIKYSTDQTNWSTTLPKRTDATPTPVTVYVKVFGDGNHKDTSIISSTITINKKTDVITMSSISTNYTGKKVEATATAESKTTITYTYYNGTTCSGTALSSAPVNAGDYSVKATSTGNNNYKSNSACATIKISNTNNPTTVSAVAGLKYGSTSNLVTTSNVQGTIYYSVGTELTSSNYKTSGSTSIPTASGKNAYTYKIYYYVDATGTNYESTKGGPVSVTISKADGSISYATKSVTKDYGNASFVNALTKTGDGTVGYSSSNTGVATIDASGKVTIIAAGTTTITAKVTDGTNYIYATKTATYTLTVNKIENTVKVSSVTGIIYGDSKSMVSATGVQGTIYYSTETELTEANYLSKGSQDIPSSYTKDSGYRNAGTYNIYYYITGNENYYAASNTSSTPIKTTISTKSVTVTWGTTPLTYNGKEQAPSASVTTGITGETMTVTRTMGTNVGNYTSTASCSSVAGGQKLCKNYTLIGNTKAFSIGKKAVTITAKDQTVNYGTAISKKIDQVTISGQVSGHVLTAITLTQSTTNATTTGTITPSGAKIQVTNTSGADVTNNYAITYAPGKLTVSKVTATLTCSNKTYNGQSQTACSCSGGTVSGGSATDAGTYTASCTPDANHTAPDNKPWTMSPKSVAVTWGTTPLTYNGKEQAPSASVTTGITGETMTVTRTMGTNVGNYTSTASCSSVAGGQKLCKNYTLTGNTKAFSIGKATLPAPTKINITTAGIVTWDSVPNAAKYQISIHGTNWTDATSGVDYLSKIIAATGTRTVYVRAVGEGNYSNSNDKDGTASKNVYAVTINSNSTTRGKVDTSSYNVIEGATYSTSSNKLSFIGVTTGTTTKTLKTVTATPSTGYYFANWSSASGSISSNATITANFAIIDYKIKYENGDASSGTLPSEQTTHYNETVTLEKNNMSKNQTNLGTVTFNYNGCGNNTTGTGYTTYVPNGWATSNNGTKAYDSGASIKWTRTSNLTLYPSWTSTNHSATFPAPTCTGYTFDGWYTAASGGSKVTSYVGSSAITYYAHWKSNIYELLLNNKKLNDNKTIYLKYGDGVYLNYANNSVSNKMTSTANPISKPKLTKDIPLFSNYIVPKEGEEDKNVPTGTSTVSFTFDGYSYKNSDSQRIKLINSDGYIADTFTNKLFTSNSVADLDIKSLQYNFGTPTKAGYTFEGWFTRPQGDSTTNVLYVPEASGSGNDHNFLENNTDKVYAHWLKNIELVSSNSDWSSSGVTISPKKISKSDSVEGASSETAKIKYQYCLAELGQTCTNYSDIDDINGSITINENGIHDIYYRAVSMFLIKNNSTDSEAITKTIVTPSVKTTVKIDNVQPEVDIVAKKVSTNQVVKSGDWSNDFLKFQFSNIKIGSSGGVIKYCIQNPSTNDSESDSESNDCEPNKLADSSNMISLSETNTKDGKYEIVYKIINSAGEESEIGKYNANIDRVAPVVTINQTNLDDDTSASPITSPNEQKLDSGNNFTRTFSQNYTTWVKSGYDFKVTVSGESDYQIRVGYNDPDLLSTDSSYKKIPELSEQEDITESGEFSLIENGYRYGVVTVTDAAGNKTTFVFHAQIDDVVPILNITAKDQKGNEIPSGILSQTGLTYTTKIIKSGVSPVKVYSCSVTAADFDPDNLCTPESPVGTGRTGNEFVQKGYANVTSMDRYIRVQGTSSSGLQSEVEADNGIEEGETGREEYNSIHYGRVGKTDIEISVYRTDNSKVVTSRKWVNSKIKFKLTPVSSTSTFKYCTGAGDIKDSGTTKCTPKTAGTTNKLVSSTRTGKFHIAYQATTGGKPGTIHYFNVYVDIVKPTLKITAYKLNSAGNGADGGALTSATNGGPNNLSGNNIKGGAWRDYYYFFSLSGSGDTGGSGIKSMVWEYNNARRYSDDTTTKKLTGKSSYTDKKVHNISFKSSGLRYGKVTLTDNAGNKVSMTITVYIDRIKQNLVLRLYSYSNGKKGDKVLKTVTETNYSTNKWVNHAYYFDVSSSTGGSPLTVTLQVNAAGAMTSNRDLIDPVYPLVNSSGKPTGHSVAASGNRYVRVIAYDRTHKDTPTVKNVRVYIDTEPPTLTWGDSSVASDGTLKINYTCKDTLSRLKDAKGNATSSLTKTATLQSTGPAKGVCVDRAGNKTTSYSSTHYYSESSVCGVDYYKCHYEREYLGVKSDSSCVSEGNVCDDSAGFGKCYCYSSGYTKQVCDEPVYNTCWH